METERRIPLHVYKTGQLVTNGDQLPVSFEERTSTDRCCTCLTTIFAIAMFVYAIVVLNMVKLQQMTYPTDSAGRHCTLQNANYNYLYFPSPGNPTNRFCLAQCPNSNASLLNCWPTPNIACAANSNPQFQVVVYPTYASKTSLGLYCLPTDPLLKQQLLTGAGLQTMFNFVSAYESIGVSLLCGMALGIFGILLFTLMPRCMAFTSTILGACCCLAFAILLFINILANPGLLPIYKTVIYVFIVIMILVALLLLLGICCHRSEISLSAKYIEEAANCLWEQPGLILVSFVFIGLLAGLTALCTFQILAFWSSSKMIFDPNYVYIRPQSTFATVMTSLCVVQFLWGLCFLKEAFNFLMSGTAVTLHFSGQRNFWVSVGRLFRFHWGSVVAGAFLLNVVYPLDLIYDLLKPNQREGGCIANCLCCCCTRLLDLARTEAMAMINLIGTPYCNSSRLCQQITYYSSYTSGGQSANRFVRIGTHVLLASLATLSSWVFMVTQGKQSILAVTVSFIVNLFVLTFFVCLLKDIAEAFLFCDLIQNSLENVEQIDSHLASPVAKKLFPDDEGYEVIRTST